jgi:phosphohistidine phosphatase
VKKLYIVRHAKTIKPSLNDDFTRALVPDGENECEVIGQYMASNNIAPELIICSPSLRTITTRDLLIVGSGIECDLLVIDEIYQANAEQLLEIIQNVSDKYNSVMVIGHNPAVSEICHYFGHGAPDLLIKILNGGVPTAGMITIDCNTSLWHELSNDNSFLSDITSPSYQQTI